MIGTTCDGSKTDTLHLVAHFIYKVVRMYLGRVKRLVRSWIAPKQ